jgi:hypothetical protein
MTEPYPEKPDFKKLATYILLLLVSLSVLILSIFGMFEEDVEYEGIVVRFILFFKQNMLI